jgi:hypothetical protein
MTPGAYHDERRHEDIENCAKLTSRLKGSKTIITKDYPDFSDGDDITKHFFLFFFER